MNEPQEERKCCNRCSDKKTEFFPGLITENQTVSIPFCNNISCICHIQNVSSPQNRPGGGREEWAEQFKDRFFNKDGNFYIPIPSPELLGLQKKFIREEINLALAAYRDAIMGYSFKSSSFKGVIIEVESIERVNGEFGI